jgi:hypothetical protein
MICLLFVGCTTEVKNDPQHLGPGWIRLVHEHYIVFETEYRYIQSIRLCDEPSTWKGEHLEADFRIDTVRGCYYMFNIKHEPPDIP